jgi:hypothetical protein
MRSAQCEIYQRCNPFEVIALGWQLPQSLFHIEETSLPITVFLQPQPRREST